MLIKPWSYVKGEETCEGLTCHLVIEQGSSRG